jgi:CheY-like chemotaxis protein
VLELFIEQGEPVSAATSKTPHDPQAVLRRLRDACLAELEARLDALEADLVALDDAARRDAAFAGAYGKVQALRGSGSMLGISIIVKVGHQLEECLSLGAAGTPAACLAHVDLLRQVRDPLMRGIEHFPEVEERLEALRAALLGGRHRVLIVETSKVNVKLCREILSGFPVHVTVLDNGIHALERLLHERYHILVTGQELNMLNGLALVAAVRLSNRHNQHIKAILLSSQKQRLFRRDTDPDHMIPRDAKFPENLSAAIQSCISQLREAR